jgi:hypothetical protein
MSEWFQLLVSIHFMTFLFSNSLVLSKLALNRLFLLIMIGELLRMCVPDAGVWGYGSVEWGLISVMCSYRNCPEFTLVINSIT